MLIRTIFVESNGNEVQFDYLMIQTGGTVADYQY